MDVKMRRYKGRYWAVYDEDDALICVCVYRKGARNLLRCLRATAHSATKRLCSCQPATRRTRT